MEFNGFSTINFTADDGHGFVYVLCWIAKDGEIPFYVGETVSIWKRLDDYFRPVFWAANDFNAGEAVKYFCSKNYRVVAKYKPSKGLLKKDRVNEETELIAALRAEGYTLLNRPCKLGYNYLKTNEVDQRRKVQDFVDEIIAARKNSN